MSDTSDRARQLVGQILELPEAQGRALIEQACTEAPSLRAQVETLLRITQATIGFIERPQVTAGDGDSLRPGTVLGPWTIVRRVGEGGMGEVYEAARSDRTFELRAAIKLLKRGMDSDAVLRRFLQERRILAQLTHPNIARPLDGGVAPDGRPYLVMEFVVGRSLTAHLLELGAGTGEILRLMITVCEAVADAHQRNIVHRDLKPGNVMVTPEGQIKLLDFGIAKVLSEDGDDATRMAGEGSAMTLAYAAPEQILGLPVTPSTDVYALGVMLYEALTGRLPYGRTGKALPEVARGLERETLVRPSTVLRRERGRFAEAERSARLRGVSRDLDMICSKALHREMPRRYASARDLADDLQRFLEHRPVRARPDSAAYRLQRFVRRNRLAVAAAGAVLLALSGGLAAALWQAGEARAQARAAYMQQQRAERIKDFVLSVFNESDPYQHSTHAQRTPQQLIAAAAARIDADLKSDPETHAQMLVELAGIRLNLGDGEGAGQMLRQAKSEQIRLHGADSLQVAVTDIALARNADLQRYDQAPEVAAQAREALDILARRGALDTPQAAEARLYLGRSLGSSPQGTDSALTMLRQALDYDERHFGADSRQTVEVLEAQAAVLDRAQRSAEVVTTLRQLIPKLEKIAGPDSVALAYPLTMMGYTLAANQPAEAIPYFQRAADIRRKETGSKDRQLADTLGRLGAALGAVNRTAEARAAFDQAQQALPEGDEAARLGLLLLRFNFYWAAERWPETEADAREAFALARKQYGDDYVYTWQPALALGDALSARGHFAEAAQILQNAQAQIRRISGADAWDDVLPADIVASNALRARHYTQAIELFRVALKLRQPFVQQDSVTYAAAEMNLAEALISQNTSANNAEAHDLLERALGVFRNGDNRSLLGKALLDRGLLRVNQGQTQAARADLGQAITILRQDGGDRSEDLRRASHALHRLGGQPP